MIAVQMAKKVRQKRIKNKSKNATVSDTAQYEKQYSSSESKSTASLPKRFGNDDSFKITKRDLSIIVITLLFGTISTYFLTKHFADKDAVEKSAEMERQRNSTIESEIQSLVNFIIANDQTSNLPPPSISETRDKKLLFVRNSQIKLHAGVFNKLSQQIPPTSEKTSFENWMAAINVHKMVERTTHKQFSASWMKSTWESVDSLQTYANEQEQKRTGVFAATQSVSMPAWVLSMASVPVNMSDQEMLSTVNIQGILIDYKPEATTMLYPVVRFAKGMVSPNKGFGGVQKFKKDQYFVPSFNDLKRYGLVPESAPDKVNEKHLHDQKQ